MNEEAHMYDYEEETILRQLKVELDENLPGWDWRIHADVMKSIYLMGDCNYSKGMSFDLSINYTIHGHERLHLSSNSASAYNAIADARRDDKVGEIPLSDPECFKKAVKQVKEVLMARLQNKKTELSREWLAVISAIKKLELEMKG